MAGVQETAQWENHVYRIEENDPVHGGEEGVTNKPIKHLANRTLYLRKLLTEAGQRITPKKITASSRNSNDLTGHTHEIDLASLTTKGLVQLTNDTGLDSEVLALTAKGGKALAQQIAQTQQRLTDGLNQKPNKSDISSAVNSESTTQIANSKAVKQAYDKATAAEQLAQTKQAALIVHTLDLSTLDQDKYYLVTFSPSGNLGNGQRWPFSILRPLARGAKPTWGRHEYGFSLQVFWTSNSDGWGTNRLYRTIDVFEYGWTVDERSPVMSIGQLGRAGIETCYLRGGAIYWAETLPGFAVQVRTESYTIAGETRQSPIEFSADLVPVVDLKKIKTDLTTLDSEAARHKRLTTYIPNTQVRWDESNPSDLPNGTVIGLGQRSRLNQGSDLYSGWQMISRPSNSELSVRFGINSGRFFYQQAKSTTHWGDVVELIGSRVLSTQHLNDVTTQGVYVQGNSQNARSGWSYPEGQAGTLWVSPSAEGVLQEYTCYVSRAKYQRHKTAGGWQQWKRIDALEAVVKSGDTMTGALKNRHIGAGSWSSQYASEAPFFVDAVGDVARSTYHPFLKGKMRNSQNWGSSFSFGWTSHLGSGDGFGRGTVLFTGDNAANTEDQVKRWFFDTNGNFVAENGDVQAGSGSSGKSLKNSYQKGDIAILTGEITHGGTLPLPAGFSESECKFFVSIRNSNPNGQGWDWNESTLGKHYRIACWNSGRSVTCQVFVNEGISGNGASPLTINATASYLVIGTKS